MSTKKIVVIVFVVLACITVAGIAGMFLTQPDFQIRQTGPTPTGSEIP